MSAALAESLLDTAVGRRHGIVNPPVVVPFVPADLPGFVNVAVPALVDVEAGPASGGIGRGVEAAARAAVGEALERYAGSLANLVLCKREDLPKGEPVMSLADFEMFTDAQMEDPQFPYAMQYAQPTLFTDAYELVSNERIWVPAPLMSLDRRLDSMTTSSGLAAWPDPASALLRATQELIERDALMTTWMHEVQGRQITMKTEYTEPVEERGGFVVAIDATPAYSPHPVAIVAGNVPRRGRDRFSLGAACRASWAEALDKAYIEWAQGITFVGDRQMRNPDKTFGSAHDVRDFDDHAVFYSTESAPDWRTLPLLAGTAASASPDSADAENSMAQQLEALVHQLHSHAIRLFYRDLTTTDLRQIGVSSVRVISPDLVPIHHDHRFPHLGGSAAEVRRRYPWWTEDGSFPSLYPHPLG